MLEELHATIGETFLGLKEREREKSSVDLTKIYFSLNLDYY